MIEKITQASWQQLASKLLKHYSALLTQFGIRLGKDLHLDVDKTTIYSYCDLKTGRISLNLPGNEEFGDLLIVLTVGNLLGTQGMAETFRFLQGMLPYLLAHELTHYLRNKCGTYTTNHWVEENTANRVGIAMAWTVSEFREDLPFLRQIAKNARKCLPLVENEAATFNQAYMTDTMAYMRQQLAWFCQQILQLKPEELQKVFKKYGIIPSRWS